MCQLGELSDWKVDSEKIQNNKAGGVQKYNNHCKIIIVKYSIAV